MSVDRSTIRTFVTDNPWFHTAVGLVGNGSFVVGSVLFLIDDLQRAGIWLFVAGSAGMFLESVGNLIAKLEARTDA